jgi:formylglycine-generating enzyme required for sulfatase activity
MTRSMLALLLVAAIAGWSGCSEGTATKPTGGSASVRAETTANPVAPEPAPFESIALASDSSYDSEQVGNDGQPGEVRELTKLGIRFCWCPPGNFRMGSSDDAPGHLNNETQFDVTLSKGFWIQQTELTQNQYEQLMGCNPAFFKGPQNPIETLTWSDATEFCRRLSELPPEKKVGNRFRLPTEAEWEYACRAGSTTEFCYGDDEAGLDEYGWYNKNSGRTTHPVGEKAANAWGLHDMHGNVSEWCQDFYGEYPRKAVTDPRGPESGERRTLRGGGWFFAPMFARSAHRDGYAPSARYVGLGFRLVATTAEAGSRNSSDEAEEP